MPEPAADKPADEAVRWRLASARLVGSLESAGSDEARLALLKTLARRLAEQRPGLGYPGFLKLLLTVADSDDAWARKTVADTFALGLKRLDLPSGVLTSWGAGSVFPGTEPGAAIPASVIAGRLHGTAPRRLLGPVEYLTVWFCQRTQRPYLGPETYESALARLVGLLDHNPEVARLYPLKLSADASEGLNGAYTRATRERLDRLAQAWKERQSPVQIAALAVRESHPDQRHWLVRDL